MKREINTALDLYNPRLDKDDKKWTELVNVVKQVVDCRRQEREDEEQNREVQVLVKKIQKLKAMVVKQGVGPSHAPSLTMEKNDTFVLAINPRVVGVPKFKPGTEGQLVGGPTRTFCCIWCDSIGHARKDCEDLKGILEINWSSLWI